MSCNVVWCDRYTGEDCKITWCPAYLPRNSSNTIDVNTIITGDTKKDLVAVVRCKNCRFAEYDISCDEYECMATGCGLFYNGDFYCADGERKETDER